MYINAGIENIFKIIGNTIKKDQRSIEQLINDISETHNRNDFLKLHRLLKYDEIFVPLESIVTPENMTSGDSYQALQHNEFKFHSQLGPNDQAIIKAATKSTSSILTNGFLRINWLDFLNIVQQSKFVDGASLEGDNAWVWFDKEYISKILH